MRFVNLGLQLHSAWMGNDPDPQMLDLCAQWRMARAEQEVNWAEHNWASMLDDSSNERTQVRTEPLNRMCELQDALARLGEPHTLLGARELLGVALKLLACPIEDPESVVDERPVLQLIRNVNEALKWLDGETRLHPVGPTRLNQVVRRRLTELGHLTTAFFGLAATEGSEHGLREC